MDNKKVRILVVDDEADLEQLMLQRMRHEVDDGRYEFEFVRNGAEALELLQKDSQFNIVLSDINMPVMDGLTLLAQISDVKPDARTIMVSAYGDMENIRTAMNHGAFDFVTKPIDFKDLKATIERSIENPIVRGRIQISRKVIVPDRMEEIRTVQMALDEFSEQQDIPPEALFQTQLSLEELFTNIVSYAHNDDQDHEVEIIFSIEDKTLTVEIVDDGYPFNPLEDAPELDVESSLEDRGIGGAGIRLAKQLMTELQYKRDSDRNRLIMTKKI